jgi:ABC-type dipeptide/oligopeptide/nickel transport system permease component
MTLPVAATAAGMIGIYVAPIAGMGGVIGASIAADGVFNLGGLASTLLAAAGRPDPFEMTALVVVSALTVSAFMLLGDLGIGLLDPHVGLG